MYAVQAIINVKEAPWTRTHQVPTFYLDENVQGFLTEEGATKIALEVLDPTGSLRDSPYHVFNITAVKL